MPANFTTADAHATYAVNNHWTTAFGQTIGQSATFNFSTPKTIGAFHLWAHRSNGVAYNPYYVATRFDLVFRDSAGTVLSTVTNIPGTPNVAVAQTKFFNQVLNVSSIQYNVRETANNNSSPYTGLAEVAFEACLPCSPSVPEARTVCPGGTASFTVAPNGTGPISYQWQRNGTDIPLAGPGGNATAQSATLVINGAGVNVDPGNPDLIFADGMETPASNADLRIESLDDGERYLTRNIQAYIDQPFQYVVRVRNVGNATATGVRLREFTPNAAVVSPPVPMQPRVTIGAWTCQNDAEQSCGTGSGELDVASISLAAGSYRDYTVTREVVTANVGDKVAISTALFFAPNDEVSKGDVSSEDNVASAIVTLLENTGPVITCIDPQIGSGPNSLPNPLNMQEDDDVREFECTMTDAEQDAITNFTASSSNISLVPNDGLLGALAGDTWELFIAPQPEASGSSTVTLTATDARGAQRVMQFTVEVAAVNDPPTFSLFSATVVQSATGDVPTNIVGDPLEGPLQFPTMEANCFDSGNTACTVSISSFIEDVVSGPSNESGQLVQPVTLVAGDCVLASGTGSLSNMFAVLPQLTPASAQASGSDFALAWTYRKNASATLAFTCTMRVQDAGGAQSGGQITFSMGN